MDFTLSIKVINGQLSNIEIHDNTVGVNIGAALQALDAARAALLNVPIAQPQPITGQTAQDAPKEG